MFTISAWLYVIMLCLNQLPEILNLIWSPSNQLIVGVRVLSVFEAVTMIWSDNPFDFLPVIELPVLTGARCLKIGWNAK